jgi:hypothetical protein
VGDSTWSGATARNDRSASIGEYPVFSPKIIPRGSILSRVHSTLKPAFQRLRAPAAEHPDRIASLEFSRIEEPSASNKIREGTRISLIGGCQTRIEAYIIEPGAMSAGSCPAGKLAYHSHL